jgi:hypothetical protein
MGRGGGTMVSRFVILSRPFGFAQGRLHRGCGRLGGSGGGRRRICGRRNLFHAEARRGELEEEKIVDFFAASEPPLRLRSGQAAPRGRVCWVGAVKDGEGSADEDRDSLNGSRFTRRRGGAEEREIGLFLSVSADEVPLVHRLPVSCEVPASITGSLGGFPLGHHHSAPRGCV